MLVCLASYNPTPRRIIRISIRIKFGGAECDRLASISEPAYAVLRIVAGFLFWCHGAQKVLGLFPGPQGPMHPHGILLVAGIIEFTCGILIAIGLLASPAAFLACGEMVKVIEALCGRSRRQGSAAHVGELFLEADQVCAGAWVARWHRASSARIAAFKRHVSNFEAYRIIFSFAEESIFPERGHAID